ncbi:MULTISPECIES: branched-chain amino acid ABC transporter permease [unclassified Rhizobium]|uniref:branched-chain amino acid ABC transporter permease n=1 Tax=unclassified Rhizobium TaxID=2613769 RepID=UPI00160D2BCA|nr:MULTISPECIES: branched-chain amino acid ABC transporter permease [unclassified Rhizobium]MBB3289068.1 branched-chain amino acid transport system permease protein [Rhizobium sp. BK252]MBB3403810.1 branched-chain amino acid transport system permease protein [Rhizobium sp. BK289]MBB3416521.1 branched-chain amino acid transport system permease protein [Rhizobium sp. BK284]MBB3484273.1 branched-chain amino acid transport system permease protein [Rhizobium sp. BK347]
MKWIDAIIQGLLLGGLYAQYAIGMSLMFGVMRIVNIAHGDLVVLLALIGISAAAAFGLGPGFVILLLVPVGALVGWVLQRGVLNFVVGEDPLPSLIATFGLSLALQNFMLTIWSADTRSLNVGPLALKSFNVGGVHAGVLPIIIFAVAVGLTALLDIVLKSTRFGRGLRAAAADKDAAVLSGVDTKSIYAQATAVAVAILGIAAVFQAARTTVSPSDGGAQLIYAFEAVIIGGMGSIWGAFAGGLILGVAQVVGAYVNPSWGILIGHLVFLLVLIFRPQGLMARQ